MNFVRLLISFAALFVWGVLVYKGFDAYLTTEATDSGFTRGMNRIQAFLGWQAAALGAALIAALARPESASTRLLRLILRLPLILSGGFFALLIILFVGMIIYSRFIA